jgi:recombination associated protein RdgC
MFKQLTTFKFNNPTSDWSGLICHQSFEPIGPSQELSIGFIKPNPERDSYTHNTGEETILMVAIETKSVPASVVRTEVDKRCDQIERETTRKPGKAWRRELSEDAKRDLLTHAFPKRIHVPVWLSGGDTGYLHIGSTSDKVTDLIVTLLLNVFDGMKVGYLVTNKNPATLMKDMLRDYEDGSIEAGKHVVLKLTDESRRSVRYDNMNVVDMQEVQDHIKQGMLPTQMSMTTERVSFVLTDSLKLKKIEFLGDVMTQNDDLADRFDADVLLATSELKVLRSHLIAALGGEVQS